jgi:hypothetical protein
VLVLSGNHELKKKKTKSGSIEGVEINLLSVAF